MIGGGRKTMAAAALLLTALLVLYYVTGGPEFLERRRQGVGRGVTLNGVSLEGMLRHEVERYVQEVARELERLPRNAYLDRKTGEVVPEVTGLKVDVGVTVERLLSAEPYRMVLPETVQLDPEITAEHLRRINRPIGQYHTWISGSGGRVTNIILATATLNNYVMMPGDLFSFNTVNGPRTAERGYQLAPVIVGNTVVPGLGGGVCQVSSTLYNAVLEAGLAVVERYPHTEPVDYVPPGRDATVSDYLDFKFINNTDRIILIRAAAWDGRIEIRLMQD